MMSLPLVKGKHREPGIIEPKAFLQYLGQQDLLRKHKLNEAILCMNHTTFERVASRGKRIDYPFPAYIYRGILVLGKFGIGGPAIAIRTEELIAQGIKKFILIGNAGAVSKNLRTGSLVICREAIRDEGTSYHYLPPSHAVRASSILTKRLQQALPDALVGRSWTHDAMYRETAAEARKHGLRENTVTEMEAASLFAVCKYRKVHSAAVFNVSDSIAHGKHDPQWHTTLSEAQMSKMIKAAVYALK